MPVRLQLFGTPKIDCGGDTFALPFERRSQVLVLLALKRSWVGRPELATMLWPEQVDKLAFANLRKTLFRLQALPWGGGIEAQGNAVRFQARTDVFEFEEALREQRIADALPLRHGELLAGFDDDESEAWSSWLSFERDRLRVAWRRAALDRLAADLEPGDGIDLSARLLDADPLDEAALRAHMFWLARGGHTSRARKAYHEFVERLAKDLGLAPGPELRAVHDALGTPVLLPTPPASVSADVDSGFIGRTVELRRIADLLAQDDCRLLCLTGPGGVGKTRLAQRAMRELAPAYAHGAVFVPLEDVASSTELGARLARELGVALAGSAEPLEQVATFLRERRMLLVLDNFEHLAADAGVLEKLLRGSPLCRMIVTSRVRLGLGMEWSFPLEGLPCPESEDHDVIEAFDAVRMFVQAARRVEPAFVADVEAAAIIDICRQVEGLPLALQLAAAWTRVLPCEAIAAELRRGTELLRTEDGAQPARHASIDAVFDHSWRLLTPVERDALARLAVFRERFTAEAARAVAAASLPALGALIDKSLLRKDGTRLFMHPLVQQFAAARLDDGGARAATEAAHAQYFGRLMVQLRSAVEGGDREAMREMDAEFESCRTAWHWAVAHGAVEMLVRCMPAIFDYCDHRCRFEEALQLVQAALESPSDRKDATLEARLIARAAHLEYRLDRYAAAEATALRALDVARAARDSSAGGLALNVLGSCCLRVGRYEDALRHYRKSLQQASARGEVHNAAVALDHVALVLKWLGRYDEALPMSLESLVAHRRLGDVAGEALCLNNLAALHLAKQDHASAGTYLRESLDLCEREGLVGTRMYALANLTEVALHSGDTGAVENYATRALAVATTLGNRPIVAWMNLQMARRALVQSDLPAARSALAQSLSIIIALGQRALRIGSVMIFAEVLAAQGEPSCARRVLAFAARHPAASAPDRDEILGRLALLPESSGAAPPWPGIELDELVHRIVVESDLAYAPLIAALRGSA
jgi:predicted ATPase/DNA-binding SARP family transcriptional activator/Tfp pilus assembly protein PilF